MPPSACFRSARRVFRLVLRGGEDSDSLFDVGGDSSVAPAPSKGGSAPEKRPLGATSDAQSREREQLRALATVSDISDSSVELVKDTFKMHPHADPLRNVQQTRAKAAISSHEDSEEEGGSDSGTDRPASREGSVKQPRGKQPVAQGSRGGVPRDSGSSVPDGVPNALLEVDEMGAGLGDSFEREVDAAHRARLGGAGAVLPRKVPGQEGLPQDHPRGTEAWQKPGGGAGGDSEEGSGRGEGRGPALSSMDMDALIERDCAGGQDERPSGFDSSEDASSLHVPLGSAPARTARSKAAQAERRGSPGGGARGGATVGP
ncbi:hypothetical protein T484DRAFT_1781350 [Baffinella frigidus]|nr:hypothetical protein T484DRAFT_1781350 [Cryptophyta sp. CCMP2293]